MKHLKRRIIACILLLCILTACQPTPEKEPVVNKGDQVLEQKIKEAVDRAQQVEAADESVPSTTAVPYAHPDRWEEFFELPNFSLSVHADIEVSGQSFPVYRMIDSDFSNEKEWISLILSALVLSPTGQRDGLLCYEDYAKKIALYSLGRYDLNLYAYVPWTKSELAEVEKKVLELTEEMNQAPLADDFAPFSSYNLEVDSQTTYRAQTGKTWYVQISENSFSVCRYQGNIYPESRYINDPPEQGQPVPTPLPQIQITEDEAIARAETFLSNVCSNLWQISDVETGSILKLDYNVVEEENTDAQGYILTCMRTLNGLTPYDYTQKDSDRLYFEDESYAATLALEKVTLFVDDEGVVGFWWENPVQLEDTVTNSIELLPFEQIQELFVQAMKNGLSWASEHPPANGVLNPTRKGHVERILLSCSFIQERNNPGHYLLVPSWLFFYTTESKMQAAEHGYTVLPDIIAINAVDGTRIDLK